METKHCRRCDTTKSVSEFFRRSGRPNGYQARCKDCARELNSQWYKVNRDYSNAKRRERNAAEDSAAREYQRRYTEQNREHVNARQRDWKARNPDKVKQTRRRYYANTADRQIAKAKRWAEANADRRRAISAATAARRRARLAGGDIRTISIKDVRRLLASPCVVPGCSESDIQIDHIIPISRGGRHAIGNLQPLCGKHNAGKCDKTWIEFRAHLTRRTAA